MQTGDAEKAAIAGGPGHKPFRRLLQSSVLLSAAVFVAGIGNLGFQVIIGRQLPREEYGIVNSTLGFVGFLGLPLTIATMAVTHYIARYKAMGEAARLTGLLAGCRRFLLRLTIAGSVLAIVLVQPLGSFFHFPRATLTLVALGCVLASLWGSFATALCQGMSWFSRLAVISVLGVIFRLLFGILATREWPRAELAVAASGVALLANLLILVWRRELALHTQSISPWNRDFVQFFVVSGACVGAGYCFTQGDLLVAQRYFSATDLGAYTAAGVLARALPMSVAPVLTVLFTHRSGQHRGSAFGEQLKLLGLYAAGLLVGATCLLVMRGFFAGLILGAHAAESAAMLGRFSATMVFVGLLQAIGMWALASRWLKLSVLYGVIGVAYWTSLLCLGSGPTALLHLMPIAAGIGFAVLFVAWLIAVNAAPGAVECPVETPQ